MSWCRIGPELTRAVRCTTKGRTSVADTEAAESLIPDDAKNDEPAAPAVQIFTRMHPLGICAAVLAGAAVIATLAGSRFLIGNMKIWHWVALIVTIALSFAPSILHSIRIGIERIGDLSKVCVMTLAWIVFTLQLFNVITRYTNNWFERDILFGQTTSAAWMSFGLMFVLGVNYAMRDGVNPRIDFWWAEFSKQRKAAIDFVLHATLLGPFIFMALRVVIPYGATSLGRKRDGSWPSGWRVWETWEQSSDASQLPVGPIQAALVLAFLLWGLQTLAELIKTGFVLAGRDDLGDVAEIDAPLRVE